MVDLDRLGAQIPDQQEWMNLLAKAIEQHGIDKVSAWRDQGKHKQAYVHLAVSKGYDQILMWMQDMGFDLNAQRGSDLCTPLHTAIFYKKRRCADTLIRMGVDRDVKNQYGETCGDTYQKFVDSYHNIIWLDLEMTQGFYETWKGCKVLEAAIIITDKDLNEIERGHWVVGGFDADFLNALPDFHQRTFRDNADGGPFPPIWHNGIPSSGNGLFTDILNATMPKEQVEKEMLALISKHCPAKGSPLAGNSIQCDREVLQTEMPNFVKYLNHRIIDVSTFLGVAERWCPDKLQAWKDAVPLKTGLHRAVQDCEESIKTMKWIRSSLLADAGGEANGYAKI